MKKVYGESKIENCPFCGDRAVAENPQGVPVCMDHRKRNLPNLKCVCGEYLDVRKGKWGPYFHCWNCGNMSFRKGLDMNPPIRQEKREKPKEITCTADEVDFLF